MKKTDQLQSRAMELVKIQPMSDEANTLINQAIEEHGFASRSDAYQFLLNTDKLVGIDVGGQILNQNAAIAALIADFRCTKETARKHVARAARRKRYPDYEPPRWGGKRPGAGRPFEHVIDVANGRCVVSQRVDGQFGLLEYSAAVNWHELEEAAATAVAQQGGAINISGQYPCPAELVETAVWDKADD
jgi:hypothetical protein